MSYPGDISASISSIHDLNTLLILFRAVARLSTCLRTTKPNLLIVNSFLLTLRKNGCVANDLGDCSLTAAGSRYCFCNMMSQRLDSQSLATFISSSLQNSFAIMGF